jgi:hypothetical protein
VVIDRLSPEQGALMLAKLRDETEGKSPDADPLLEWVNTAWQHLRSKRQLYPSERATPRDLLATLGA